jgi:DNA-binding response OmpR family regulator
MEEREAQPGSAHAGWGAAARGGSMTQAAIQQPMADQRILVVDDDRDVRDLLAAVLRAGGYEVVHAADGTQALRMVFEQRPHLVITDVGMPGMDGWAFLQRLREFSQTPVIMLSGYSGEQEKVRGLHTGADDYVVKPVPREELLARVGAVLRRSAAAPEAPGAAPVYRDAELVVDLASHEVSLRGRPVSLSPQEFRLLVVFLRHPGMVLSSERLLDLAWGGGAGGPENVRVYMGYLRRKLDRGSSHGSRFETVRGFGYRFVPAR